MKSTDVFIIAEVGQAHDGSLGILHSYIDAVAKTGVDAIKFQTHIAEAESSEYEPFRVNFSYVDKTRYDYWKRMSFSYSQWVDIKAHCEDVGLEFISSPFSIEAVELLEKLGVNKYKFGSGEITNALMLDVVAQTGKEIILSSGMSSYKELDMAVNTILRHGNELSVLQCTTKYPTQFEDVGLNVLNEMKSRYNGVSIGLSDHSGSIFPSIAAASLGAKLIEAHVTFDRDIFGPDSTSSLTLGEFSQMVEGVRAVSKMLNNPIDKSISNGSSNLKTVFGKTLAIRGDLSAGHVICVGDLETKKPAGYGIAAAEYAQVIGRKTLKSMTKNDFLKAEDLSEND